MKTRLFLTTALIITFVLGTSAQNKANKEQKYTRAEKSINIYNDVLRQLDMNYVDSLPYETLTETAINSMLRKIDPYTIYYPKQKEDDLRMMTTGKYGGVGAVIAQRNDKESKTDDAATKDSRNKETKAKETKAKETRYIYISDPYEGMPAQQADIRAGDKIINIDGKSTINKSVKEVSDMLRGVPETELKITLLREGQTEPIVKTLIRKEIKLPAVDFYTALPDHLGYISFTEFTEKSADDFRRALQTLVEKNRIDSLVIDLRGNGGGIIDEAVKILSLFVEKGTTVVETKGKDPTKNRIYKTISEPAYPDMPLYVLVNSQSASASEILCGALQDLDRATLIGTRTYGKGLVQNIRSISYDGHLKVTTAKYYIPSGRCIQAIDYSKRRNDGSVERVPDSLTHEFKTKKGRIVRDGGGIVPDINTEDTLSKVDISYSLFINNLFFDYATHYRATHAALPLPADFVVEDTLINDFETFLQQRNFTYETESSKYLNEFLQLIRQEDLDSTVYQQVEALRPMLIPSVHDAIQRNKTNIQMYLGSEIVSRYYFQKGRIEYNLRFDKDLKYVRRSK